MRPDFFVQFYPTLRCNISCEFCFNRGLEPHGDIALEEFSRMLDRLREAGVATLDLLGGEPTLHPRIGELVSALSARGMKTTLSTNGRGDLALLERLEQRFGREVLRVGVSVNEDTAPRELRSYIERRRPMLKSVCSRGWRLPRAAVEHVRRADTEFYLIFRDPVSRSDLEDCLSYPEYLERLDELRRQHPRAAGVACAGFVPEPGGVDSPDAVRCPAGTTKLSVLPDGSVYPCYLLFSRPQFRLGNLRTDSFETIVNHPQLEFFRTFRGNACPRRECAHHSNCRGGCPAASLLLAGDLAAPDPRCVTSRDDATSCPGRSGCAPARR